MMVNPALFEKMPDTPRARYLKLLYASLILSALGPDYRLSAKGEALEREFSPEKPKPVKTGDICPGCGANLSSFELLYGCYICSKNKKP